MAENLQHSGALHLSSLDLVQFARSVRERYNDLIHTHQRLKGAKLVIPQDLISDYQRCAKLMKRHHRGDPRHTEAEIKSLNSFAQWTLDINSELRNQPKKTFRPING